MPTSAAAAAPNACENAVRCGMAVIGVYMAMTYPARDPITMPTTIHSKRMILWWNSVPTMASTMPNSASTMPLRAVSGDESMRRPRMKRMLAVR